MAFVDVYGSETNEAVADVEIDVVDEACLPVLQALLPPGLAWPREADATLTKLLRALAYEFCRVKDRGQDLLSEIDPRTTLELLEDWERVFGLPDECSTPTTIAGRRTALHGKMLGFGDPSEAYFVALALSLGYTITITTYTHEDHFTCLSPCTDPLYGDDWMFVWDVATENGLADAQLQCTFESLAPLHTLVRFFFDLPAATWVYRSTPNTGSLRAVAHNGTRWLAVGIGGYYAESTDGITWTAVSGVVQPDTNDYHGLVAVPAPFGVDGSAGCWVAVGEGGSINRYEEGGVAWELATSPTIEDLHAVAYADGRVIAVGVEGIFTSDDGGETWALAETSSEVLNALARHPVTGVWLAVGENETAYRSTDNGTTWALVELTKADGSPAVTGHLRAVAHDGVQWLVTGAPEEDTTATSTNGSSLTWTPRDPADLVGAHADAELYGIIGSTLAAGFFLVVGGSGDDEVALIGRTQDGDEWVLPEHNIAEVMRAVTKHPTLLQWVAVGDNGKVGTSGI